MGSISIVSPVHTHPSSPSSPSSHLCEIQGPDRRYRLATNKTYGDYRRRVLAGEEHWRKVLQVNADSTSTRNTRCRGCSRSPSPRLGGHTPLGPRQSSPCPRNPSPIPSPSPQPRRRRSKSIGRSEGIFHSLTKRVRNWINSRKRYEISPTDCLQFDEKYVWGKHATLTKDLSPRSYNRQNEDLLGSSSELHSVQGESPEHNGAVTVVQITYSAIRDHDTEDDLDTQAEDTPHLLKPPGISGRHLLRASRYKHREKQLAASTGGRPLLTETISCPPTSPETESVSPHFRPRCSTWPLQGSKTFSDDGDCDNLDLSFLRDNVFERSIVNGKKSIEDFSIQFEDLAVTDCVRVGRRCTLLRGRWHGNVSIHLFREMKDTGTECFWSHLTKLCRIRHENINLFMGACTVPPNRAVITSIHVQREKLSSHVRVETLRQVAVGMGYLHAKGIVLRKLNTKNIFLAPRVKISAMDFGFAECKYDRRAYSCIPRGHLTYVAPEVLATMVTLPPRLVTSSAFTYETDVYAFGTVIYEVLSFRFPYSDIPVESLIWQVCKGRRQSLSELSCTAPLKDLIEDCWAHEPCYRPDFPELSKELLKNSPMYKRHSSSVPERLHRTDSFLNRLSPF